MKNLEGISHWSLDRPPPVGWQRRPGSRGDSGRSHLALQALAAAKAESGSLDRIHPEGRRSRPGRPDREPAIQPTQHLLRSSRRVSVSGVHSDTGQLLRVPRREEDEIVRRRGCRRSSRQRSSGACSWSAPSWSLARSPPQGGAHSPAHQMDRLGRSRLYWGSGSIAPKTEAPVREDRDRRVQDCLAPSATSRERTPARAVNPSTARQRPASEHHRTASSSFSARSSCGRAHRA